MKIDILETHDRLKEFTSKDFEIGECCQDMINQRPFGKHPFYIFAHTRTHEDGVSQRLIWQPRLTKPKAETNSMLFKAYPKTDMLNTIWIIPKRELWGQYNKGNLLQNETVSISIDNFLHHRNELEEPEDDDLTDREIDALYRELAQEARRKKMMENLWKPQNINLLKNQILTTTQMKN